ncbi:hypothetical protein MM300_19685 [Evansella sp. LMS18]|jgi:hypothetical protein|uniref:hypothetical protein n=1 Tax=Evansella sp. LMS18 TaxID=2924033 RepID=UPI0020D093DC|nr:hypothetical protein [Evansella sp. LMS18]UTR10073.1 hypothetical protein MM300_19685 [Evansella sp. LMS18]
MNKGVIGFAVIILLVITTLVVFQEPQEQVEREDEEVLEELKEENERLSQEILDIEYKAELYESRYYDQEIQYEALAHSHEDLELRLEEILKDIYGSDLEESDLENLPEYLELYESRFMEYHQAIDDFDILFRMVPDPELTAGEEFEYVFSFFEEYEVYDGKEVAITAKHQDTEESVTLAEPQKRSEEEMERLEVSVTLPEGGFWTFEVSLDGELYGDVEIFVSNA